MKQNSKCKRIATIFLVILVLSVAFIGNLNNVYAKTNTLYGDDDFKASQIDVDEAVSDSVIIQGIGYLVYAVAGFIENIVTWMMGIFTGVESFPWADKVIFNTISFLDINFLNPEPGSLFSNANGSTTVFGTVIQNIYYTIFTLTVAFFGVVVGIMALRLAISSIASEKAKYKEAITNWLLALILIFTAHYLMSFVFWINEKMVEVATTVALGSLEGTEIDQISINTGNLSYKEARAISGSALYSAFEAGWGTDEVDLELTMDYGDALITIEFELEEGSSNDSFSTSARASYIDFKGYTGKKSVGRDKTWIISSEHSVLQLIRIKMAELLLDENYMDDNYGWTIDYNALSNSIENSWDKIGDGVGETIDGVLGVIGNSFKATGEVIADACTNDIEDDMKCVLEDAMVLALLDQEVIDYMNTNWGINIDLSDEDYVYNDIRCYWYDPQLETGFYAENIKTNEGSINMWTLYDPNGQAIYGSVTDPDSEISKIIYNNNMTALYAWNREKFYEHNPEYEGYELRSGDRTVDFYEIAYNSVDWWYLDGGYKDLVGKYAINATARGTEEIFSGLGEYFKKSVYGINNDQTYTEYTQSKFNFIGAILYAMFVFQSLMYFIAYFKRFFYIIVLALVAPLVIVYDFLNKSIG